MTAAPRAAVDRATVSAALGGVRFPNPAADGDCIPVSDRVVAALAAAGFAATLVTVVGWVDPAARLLGFMHRAVRVGDLIVDGTATQFAAGLPVPMVEPVEDYERLLSAEVGLTVTVGGLGDG